MNSSMRKWWLLWAWPVLAAAAPPGDWPSWRGPDQNGRAPENAVVKSWSLSGENLLWKSEVGARNTPVLLNGRLYFSGPVGEGEATQERVVCLNADTGQMLWEHRFNVFHTDIVENRVGWPSMVADPETGNVYAHGAGGELFGFDRDGRVLWKVSLTEQLGRISGYGGRLHDPIIDGKHLIMTFSNSSWGDQARALHRLVAFDKQSGEVVWWSSPGEPPPDPTCYATPVVAVIGGRRMIIAPQGDGRVYGLDARTGEKLWGFHFSKLGLNVSPVVAGNHVFVGHSEENLTGIEMGSVACIDASKRGDITQTGVVWRVDGLGVGYASPAIANGRLYVIDNSANLFALDARTGQRLWEYSLGRVGKGSPVVTADGVIYATEQNGTFHILRDAGDHCEPLHKVTFTREDGLVDEIFGSPVVAGGRVYFTTRYGTYALGVKDAVVQQVPGPAQPAEDLAAYADQNVLLVTPAEVTLAPDWPVPFYVEHHKAGKVLLEPEGVEWSVEGVDGALSGDGRFTAASNAGFSAGHVIARLGELEARARVRISPRPPYTVDFENLAVGGVPAGWIGVTRKMQVIERDGGKVLMKLAENPSAPFTRVRAYMTRPIPAGHTVAADMLGAPKGERFKPDMGLVNCRYVMIMLGNAQKLRLVTWESMPRIQKDIPFPWSTNAWYRAKLQVEPAEDGKAAVRAKVWPRDADEPEDWTIEIIDSHPNTEGSPGIYGYSTGTTASSKGTEIFYDNIQVTRNETKQQ